MVKLEPKGTSEFRRYAVVAICKLPRRGNFEALLALGATIYEADAFALPNLKELRDEGVPVESVEVRQWFPAPHGGFWRAVFYRTRHGRHDFVEDHGHVAA